MTEPTTGIPSSRRPVLVCRLDLDLSLGSSGKPDRQQSLATSLLSCKSPEGKFLARRAFRAVLRTYNNLTRG